MVLIHGHCGNRSQLLPEARFLHDAGYAVAMPDLRSHGRSDRAPVTFGALEAVEVSEFTRALIAREGLSPERIFLFGMSLGAVVAIRTGALMPEVDAVVADSPYVSVEAMGKRRLGLVLPAGLVGAAWVGVREMGAVLTGADPGEMEVTRWVRQLGSRPLFLIHTAGDANIPSADSRRLAATAPGPVELWISPGDGHVQTRSRETDEYRRRILRFLESAG